jgi:ribulose-5-phosphate 4-epimerase/fuculose-1-phosphate aldolase
VVIDEGYGGLAFEDEGTRCAAMLQNPRHKVMVMGNHGVLVLGSSVADAFNRLYYFERSAETYIRALQTGQKLRLLSDEVAEGVANAMDHYDGQADRFFDDIKTLLDKSEPDFRS